MPQYNVKSSSDPINVTVVGDRVIIDCPVEANPPRTDGGKGKSLLLCSTRGMMRTMVAHKGRQLNIGLNITTPAPQ